MTVPEEKDRVILQKAWVALRGVGMGAPLDPDYARELADNINPLIKHGCAGMNSCTCTNFKGALMTSTIKCPVHSVR